MDDYIVKPEVEVSVEVIKRVWTNLKNWNCWDFSDFRLTKTEGETVEKVLKLFLEALPFLEEDKDGCKDKDLNVEVINESNI